jgi:hypothetical protein
MKILFVLGASSRIRNFEHAITMLAERGHTLQLTGRPRKGSFELPKTLKHKRVTARENPTLRSDEWRDHVDLVRGARDYVRYLDPRYAGATRLVRRAYEISPTEFVLFCEQHAWLKRHWRPLARLLALCEDLIPSDPGVEAFIRQEKPDLMLVTPLVTFESYQTDYVKAAHRLGIPVAFLPFSWDNLTNKGLMRVRPDRVLVWNDTQKQEAVELHGVHADTVTVTGAARFDDFFARTPSTSRPEFFEPYGLDPDRPMLLYLGSSQLTGPNEIELVRRWAESLRQAEDPIVRTCGILVRPHPALKASWESVDLSALQNVGVSLHASRKADQELYDSLHHAHAAVGLNTSAMLEAAIVGRPVHTLVIPCFDEGQVGTIHFRYLVEAHGGLATVCRSFAEHHAVLAPILKSAPASTARSRMFAEGFLRPRGIDRPVSPVLADEIESMAGTRKRARRFAPVWHPPLRWLLRAWLQHHRTHPAADAALDRSPVATSMSLRPVKTALEELRQGTDPIFVGPWLDEAGLEVLYWIPFVRWAVATYGLAPERLVVISHGRAKALYGSLATRYLDAEDLFSGQEYGDWRDRTIPQSQQNPKQAVMYPMDQEIIQRATTRMDLSSCQVLHPLMFFRVLQRLRGDNEMHRIREVLTHRRITCAATAELRSQLPDTYAVASLAFTTSFPDSPENRAFLRGMLERLAKGQAILVDDLPGSGPAMPFPSSGRVVSLSSLKLAPGDAGSRTAVIAGAQAFVGGLGDTSLLASACGVPTVGFYSDAAPEEWVKTARSLGEEGTWGPFTVQSTADSAEFRLPSMASA